MDNWDIDPRVYVAHMDCVVDGNGNFMWHTFLIIDVSNCSYYHFKLQFGYYDNWEYYI